MRACPETEKRTGRRCPINFPVPDGLLRRLLRARILGISRLRRNPCELTPPDPDVRPARGKKAAAPRSSFRLGARLAYATRPACVLGSLSDAMEKRGAAFAACSGKCAARPHPQIRHILQELGVSQRCLGSGATPNTHVRHCDRARARIRQVPVHRCMGLVPGALSIQTNRPR